MERQIHFDGIGKPSDLGRSEQNANYQPGASIGSVLTDAVLNELKHQSTNGCLLCLLEAWEGEEWD